MSQIKRLLKGDACLGRQRANRSGIHAQACVAAEADRDVLQQDRINHIACAIRVSLTDGPKECLERCIDEINAEPVAFKWTYGIDDAIRV